jgi:hypothetical protein
MSVDVEGLANVTRIGDGFTSGMACLTALDVRPLSRVESVGDDFLSWCSGRTIPRIEFGDRSGFFRALTVDLLFRG